MEKIRIIRNSIMMIMQIKIKEKKLRIYFLINTFVKNTLINLRCEIQSI